MTDLRDAADFARKRARESFACRGCGSLDPAIIREDRCSDCTCYLAGHIDDCPGEPYVKEGHVLREGWVAIDSPYGAIEVEVK